MAASLRKHIAARISAAVAAVALMGGGKVEAAPTVGTNTDVAASPLDAFRVSASDQRRILEWELAWAEQRRATGCGRVTALALSAGGANGAFGAGVMVGWTEAGGRPTFDVVTGVSAGALIAPFVFAGPAWDERLRAAHHDRRITALAARGVGDMVRFAVSAVFGASLVDVAPLAQLVEAYADEEMVRAIAAEHARGRRLLVATTNRDTQDCAIWDLGAIATASLRPEHRDRALRLFRSVLVASASVPGLFPPTPIAWDPSRPDAVELHVDGAVITPFFLAPGSISADGPKRRTQPAEVYLIINGNLDPRTRATRRAMAPIMLRAFKTMTRANARSRVAAMEMLAERHGAELTYAAIPDCQPSDPFDFKPDTVRALFGFGRREAASGRAFRPTALRLAAA